VRNLARLLRCDIANATLARMCKAERSLATRLQTESRTCGCGGSMKKADWDYAAEDWSPCFLVYGSELGPLDFTFELVESQCQSRFLRGIRPNF
jgi:hypothetical protein